MHEPRGTPSGASPEYKKIAEDWGIDGHSHSYFTVREILDFPGWEKYNTTHRGWVTVEEYEQFRSFGKPRAWAGGISGTNLKKISNEDMADLADLKLSGKLPEGAHYYTQVEWTEGYKESCPFFIKHLVPHLREMAGFGDLRNVRIIFFFDN